MAGQKNHTIRLGVFVLAGLGVLLAALFLVGKNQHLLGSHFTLRAQFKNVSGLRLGNNVRYAGIEVGTISKMEIINDTLLEVSMLLNKEMSQVIRRDAIASIGADGLMGSKVVNIVPQGSTAAYVAAGDLLPSRQAVEIEDVLRTLAGTGKNIHEITEDLKQTVARINGSEGIWKLLDDPSLASNIKKATLNLEAATENAALMTRDVQLIVGDIKAGKGPLGTVLKDTLMAKNLRETVAGLENVAGHAETLAADLDRITRGIDRDISQPGGPANLILKDTAVANHISRTLEHVEKGTSNFNLNMEALKSNFLFRGYFRRMEKEKARQQGPKN